MTERLEPYGERKQAVIDTAEFYARFSIDALANLGVDEGRISEFMETFTQATIMPSMITRENPSMMGILDSSFPAVAQMDRFRLAGIATDLDNAYGTVFATTVQGLIARFGRDS